MPPAWNNLAVLPYSEISDAMEYDGKQVIGLLEEAERRGCSAACYNIGVLHHNRGEADKARLLFGKQKP